MRLMLTFITYINYRLAELHASNWTLAPAGSGDATQLLISYHTNKVSGSRVIKMEN